MQLDPLEPSDRITICPDPLEKPTARTESAFLKKVRKMLYGRFVHVGKTLSDLQILGSELHQNAFGGRAPPGPAGGAIALPRSPSRYGRAGEGVGNRDGGKGYRKGSLEDREG